MPQIDGTNGTWDCNVRPAQSGTGLDKITITFTPKKGTACKKIRLVQTCKPVAYGEGGVEIPGPPENWYKADDPPLYRPTSPDFVKDPDGRVQYIDHLGCSKDPYLDEEDIDELRDGASRTTDFPVVIYPSIIKDKVKKIVKFFVTAAICVETGEILGSIAWSSSSTPNEEGKIKLDPSDKEVPADDMFKAAMREYVKNHTRRRPADGKIHWRCPDKVDGVPKASPFGEEVPEGFQKVWLALDAPRIRLSPDEKIGGGARFLNAGAAYDACRQSPAEAAIKFTWAGGQDRPIAGVIFACRPIAAEDIAPHVEAGRRFTNDFIALRLYRFPPRVLSGFLSHLRKLSPSRGTPNNPVAMTLIAGIDGKRPASFTLSLSRDNVTAFARKAAGRAGAEDMRLKGLTYLALNLGAGASLAGRR